jgi:hypothetical protein
LTLLVTNSETTSALSLQDVVYELAAKPIKRATGNDGRVDVRGD